jgi:predicted RNase H-like HicB family nuclease
VKYTAVYLPYEDGGYTVAVPALPGCVSEGDSLEEARVNIREAAEGWLEAAADEPRIDPLPETPELFAEQLASWMPFPAGEPLIEEFAL